MNRKTVVAMVGVLMAGCAVLLVPQGVFAGQDPPGGKPAAVKGPAGPGKADRPAATGKAPGRPAKRPAGAKKAKQAPKHTFLLFYKPGAAGTDAARGVVKSAAGKLDGKVRIQEVDVTAGSARGLLAKYQVDPARTPLPLVLVIAPNGAIVNGQAVSIREKALLESLAGPKLAACFKGLQDGKVVAVCVQNARISDAAAAMKGVRALAADKKYAGKLVVVTVDPKDPAEKRLLSQLQVSPQTRQAVTVLLAPPGMLAGRFVGATQKDKLAAALAACGSGCASPG